MWSGSIIVEQCGPVLIHDSITYHHVILGFRLQHSAWVALAQLHRDTIMDQTYEAGKKLALQQ